MAAFPLGGIGTGTVSVGARGEFRDWELANRPNKRTPLPYTFTALRLQAEGSLPVVRVLESEHHGPHDGDSGYHIGKVAGLPRLATSTMRSSYPFVEVDFDDPSVPADIRMEAFTPFVPLDARASGYPAAVIRYHVTNTSSTPIEASLAFSMMNPVGMTGVDVFDFPTFRGQPQNSSVEGGGSAGLLFTSDLPGDDPLFGSVALLSTQANRSVCPMWAVSYWWDGVQEFWDSFTASGRLLPVPEPIREPLGARRPLTAARVGSVAAQELLPPGRSATFEFVLAWYLPHRPQTWDGLGALQEAHPERDMPHFYSTRFEDALDVAEQLIGALPGLESRSRSFAAAMTDSTIPEVVVEQVTTTIAALRSTTCLWLDDGSEDGVFAAWEGSFDHAGSCEGTCTHVWNYAQTVAHLFPALERSARRVEFLGEVDDEGKMNFRGNSVFDGPPHGELPAADGQLGTIIRLYREWRISGDDHFLRELWPAAVRAIEFAGRHWDADGDGMLDSQQHNTYDIEFYGPNSLVNSLYVTALSAAARMARHLGEETRADEYDARARQCAIAVDARLYNGEYYAQDLDDIDQYRYQYGSGCLSDQVFGQTLAHLVGLGHVLPADHARSAVKAVFDHNFTEQLRTVPSVQRTYALGGESGLVLCTWPRGGRPKQPFVYSDEVWTGIEFQVATHLAYEGWQQESLRVLEAVRARHDGIARSPWNHIECGNHYARSLASWGVLLAFTGVQWDAPTGELRIAPLTSAMDDGRIRCYVSTGEAWGVVVVAEGTARIELRGGWLRAANVTLQLPTGEVFVASDVDCGPGPLSLTRQSA